nr:hypothetical protein [Corynebacterium glutamicum]
MDKFTMEEALSHRVGPDFRIADVDPTSTPGFEWANRGSDRNNDVIRLREAGVDVRELYRLNPCGAEITSTSN